MNHYTKSRINNLPIDEMYPVGSGTGGRLSLRISGYYLFGRKLTRF